MKCSMYRLSKLPGHPGVSGNSRSRSFPRMEASDSLPEFREWIFSFPSRSRISGMDFFSFPSRSRISGMDFFHSFPVPEFREWIFSIPFPIPNFGNGFFPFPSRSRILGMGFFNSLPVPESSKVNPAHPWIIWTKATFFFEQLFPVVARTWLEEKSDRLFLGPKFRFLAQKSDFCHTTPILDDDPFLALGMTVNFPPWEQFFDFPFRSYSLFRKKIWLTAQKVFPPPTVGVPSASKSPSALSARA